MSEMVLKCENLVKQYKDKRALDNVSLTLERGKIYGLIGRNGAGKTTLLSILTAQNPATHGTVTLGRYGKMKRHYPISVFQGRSMQM